LPLRLNAGVSRKVGLPDYGSVGASCNIELELDSGLLDGDLKAFNARVRRVYIAAHRAVFDELKRLQAPIATPQGMSAPAATTCSSTNDRVSGNGRASDHRFSQSQAVKKATKNQIKAIHSIACRQNTDLVGLLRQEYDVERPEELSLKQASELIDSLRACARN
jgi:hypothetical protein